MPTYLYECENCGRFEEFQKITADPLEECPECSSEVRKIIGSPGIIFKGSGFYVNDKKEAKNPASGSNNGNGEAKSGDQEKVS